MQKNIFFSVLGILVSVQLAAVPASEAKTKRTPEEEAKRQLSLLKMFIPSFKKTLDLNEKMHFQPKPDPADQEATEQYELGRNGIRKATEGTANNCRSVLRDARRAIEAMDDSNPNKEIFKKELDVHAAAKAKLETRLANMVKGIYSGSGPARVPRSGGAEPPVAKAEAVAPAAKVSSSCMLPSVKLTRGPWNPCRGGKCYPEFLGSKNLTYFEAKDAKGVRIYVKCASTKWKGSTQTGKDCKVVGMPSDPTSHSYGSCKYLDSTSRQLNRLRIVDNKRYWKPYFKKIRAAKKPPVRDADGSAPGGGMADAMETCEPTGSNSVLDQVGTKKEPEQWATALNHEAAYYESSAHLTYGLSLSNVAGQCEKAEGLKISEKLCVIPAKCTVAVTGKIYSTVVYCGSNEKGECPAFLDCKNDSEKFDALPSAAVAAASAPASVSAPEAGADAADSTEREMPIRPRDMRPAD